MKHYLPSINSLLNQLVDHSTVGYIEDLTLTISHKFYFGTMQQMQTLQDTIRDWSL